MANLILFVGLVMSILWLIIGWKAMRAHEALAAEAKRNNDRMDQIRIEEAQSGLLAQKKQLVDQKKLYHRFLREKPEVDDMPSKDRHELFRD